MINPTCTPKGKHYCRTDKVVAKWRLSCTEIKHLIYTVHSTVYLYNHPPKLTPWCPRGGTSQLTGRPCSCTQRQKVALWHACGMWSVRWRRPGSHRSLLLERHPKQPPGRRWLPGNSPTLSLFQHLSTPQTGGITPRRGRVNEYE